MQGNSCSYADPSLSGLKCLELFFLMYSLLQLHPPLWGSHPSPQWLFLSLPLQLKSHFSLPLRLIFAAPSFFPFPLFLCIQLPIKTTFMWLKPMSSFSSSLFWHRQFSAQVTTFSVKYSHLTSKTSHSPGSPPSFLHSWLSFSCLLCRLIFKAWF